MSSIYIIAGPPGIGKSTSGHEYIDPDLDILNEDVLRMKYKAIGYTDYNEYSIHRVQGMIKDNLIRNNDFALELNLGYPHQYDYILSTKRFSHDNKLHVVLFFTDQLQLCLDRAEARYASGSHLVKPEIIREMYANTVPLLKENFDKIDELLLVDTNSNDVLTFVARYTKSNKEFFIRSNTGSWFINDVKPYIESQLALTNFQNPSLKPIDPDMPENKRSGGRKR
ncbi:MAG: hypothetical protein EOO01_39400 [Chitinophagaceae bacterium]|nr:MAG: hypothetical protein EOO01_39400 [Chitinophagaceae bacterium]